MIFEGNYTFCWKSVASLCKAWFTLPLSAANLYITNCGYSSLQPLSQHTIHIFLWGLSVYLGVVCTTNASHCVRES